MAQKLDRDAHGTERQSDAAHKTSDTRSVFVISPIGAPGSEGYKRSRLVLDYIIKKAFPEPGWRVIRADDENSPDSITTQVIDRIVNSDLLVADLTGHNPNVFYELAVAHGYQRPVVQMITHGETPPFDVTDQRVIFYDLTDPASVDDAVVSLSASAEWLGDNPDKLRTPLSTHGVFTAISSTQPGTESNEAIAQALGEIVSRLARLERATVVQDISHFSFHPEQEVVKREKNSRWSVSQERAFAARRLAEIDEELMASAGKSASTKEALRLQLEKERMARLAAGEPA